jgi:hypothetical protein
MKNTFQVLAGFLKRFEDEVEGRELPEPTPEMETKLREFARGKLRGPDQNAVMDMLKHNPQLIARLAEQVKALRNHAAN